jgi:hypothetical protein
MCRITLQKVHIWRESPQQVQNVVSTVIPYDPFTFDARTQFDRFVLVVKYMMR